MRTPNWKPVEVARRNGFVFILKFHQENQNAREHFTKDCDWTAEQYAEIKDNYWFCAEVEAQALAIVTMGDELNTVQREIAQPVDSTYLGCNCYKNKADVIDTQLGGYLPQMIDEVEAEALEVMKRRPELFNVEG